MGVLFSRLKQIFTSDEMKEIAIVGLDNAGKTTILYRMKHNSTLETIPTIGFNVENFMVGNTSFNVWDIGGQDEIRSIWFTYVEMAAGVVFVVEVKEPQRWEKAGMELEKIYSDHETKHKPLLVLANKADNPDEQDLDITLDKMVDALRLKSLGIHYAVFHVAAKDGPYNPDPLERLVPAFEWMVNAMKGDGARSR